MTDTFSPQSLEQQQQSILSLQRLVLGSLVLSMSLCLIPLWVKLPRQLNMLMGGTSFLIALFTTETSRRLAEQERLFLPERVLAEDLHAEYLDTEAAKTSMLFQAEMMQFQAQLQSRHREEPPRQLSLAQPEQQQQAIAQPQPGAVQSEPIQEPGLPFLTEDLAQRMAETTHDPKTASSIIVACPPNTGKSNFIRASIKAAHDLHQGRADFYVFAGKDDETYCGLEKDPRRYMYSADHELTPIVYSRFYALRPRLRKAPGFATINILEETNNTIQAAQLYDKFNKKNKQAISIETLLEAGIYEQVTKGRSKLFTNWMTTHSANKEDINLNGAIKRGCNFVVLARDTKYGAISDALQGRNAIVDDELIRKRLYEQFLAYLDGPQFNPNRVLALTNLRGRWRLVFLPNYPDHQPEIQCLIPPCEFSDRPIDISGDLESEEETDPYAYRYNTEGYQRNRALAMSMTQGQCCYPGCDNAATEVHHARYQDENGNSICDNPVPGVHLYPLCDDHHQDKSNPECAHHQSNWLKGSCPEPLQIDSRNTDSYLLTLKQGWLQKIPQQVAA